jgi:hypothetical protein
LWTDCRPTGSNPFHRLGGPLAAILPLFPRRFQFPIPVGLNLLLMPGEHVLRRDGTAANLQSSAVVVGRSSKMSIADQARDIGLAWERMPEPRPRITLEIFTRSGQEQAFYLGPHSPQLTPKEIELLHKIWLKMSDKLDGEEIHHHDIIHFALTEVEREITEDRDSDVLKRMRDHLHEIQNRRLSS